VPQLGCLGRFAAPTFGPVFRFVVAPLVLASVVGCTAAAASPTPLAQPTQSAQPPRSVAASPTPSPNFAPGPASAVGTVTRIDPRGLTIRNPDGELEVDLSSVRSVWKETHVSPLELEVGDELFVNGVLSGMTFHALYVDANIGRRDGIIRTIAGAILELVALPPRALPFQMELSRWVEVVHLDGSAATIADLRAGMTIGAVVYRPKNSTVRATKIWF
jgi:hypothetical protein